MLGAWPQPGDSGLMEIQAQSRDPPGDFDFLERCQLRVIPATPLDLSETLEDAC